MLSGWKRCKLGDVLTLQRGFDITKKEQKQGFVSVISSSGIHSYHDTAKVNGPAVIIGRKGSLGTVFYIEEDCWPHDTTLWVKDFHSNFPKFTYYFLSTLNLAQFDVGASNPTLNRNHIHLLPVCWPPLPIQRKIASVLSAYDDLIENNTRRIAILEEMAQSLYREWFVHFRFPGHERKRMVESVLGLIPEGWEVVKLEDAIELAYGKALKAENRLAGEIPVYGSGGIVGYHSEGLVKGPGIIVGRKGNIGSVFWSDTDFFPIDTVFYVRSRVCLYYIYYNLLEQHFINNDAAVPGLNRNQAYLHLFLLPSEVTLAQFEYLIRPFFWQIKKLMQKNANLCQTRDLLLPKLISGEVDVERLELDNAISHAV